MTLDWNTSKVKYFNDNPDDLWVKYNEGTKEEYSDEKKFKMPIGLMIIAMIIILT